MADVKAALIAEFAKREAQAAKYQLPIANC
jgi:hypothetical protein